MLKLMRGADGYWVVDVANTPEAADIAAAFGTTILPLPLTANVGRLVALEFARQTALGLEYGVTL